MNDFIAVNKGQQDEGSITNDGFFPDISLSDLRHSQGLDHTITTIRLKQTAITAIGRINAELIEYKKQQQAENKTELSQIDDQVINGESLLIHHYNYAVYCFTHALLIERYRDFDATEKGIKKTESVIQTSHDLYREARYAIRDILSISHSTFELI